jgi:hypothetical protein
MKVLVAMKLFSDDTRVKWALAVFLALVAAYLDGYGFLVLGTYVGDGLRKARISVLRLTQRPHVDWLRISTGIRSGIRPQ